MTGTCSTRRRLPISTNSTVPHSPSATPNTWKWPRRANYACSRKCRRPNSGRTSSPRCSPQATHGSPGRTRSTSVRSTTTPERSTCPISAPRSPCRRTATISQYVTSHRSISPLTSRASRSTGSSSKRRCASRSVTSTTLSISTSSPSKRPRDPTKKTAPWDLASWDSPMRSNNFRCRMRARTHGTSRIASSNSSATWRSMRAQISHANAAATHTSQGPAGRRAWSRSTRSSAWSATAAA